MRMYKGIAEFRFHWLGVVLNLLKVFGYTWDPQNTSSVLIGMKGQQKRIFFSFLLVFSKAEFGKSFVPSPTSKDIGLFHVL